MNFVSQVFDSVRSVYQAVSDGVKMIDDIITPQKSLDFKTFFRTEFTNQKTPTGRLNCDCSTRLFLDFKKNPKLQKEISRLLESTQQK